MINPIDGTVTVTEISPRASLVFQQNSIKTEDQFDTKEKWNELIENLKQLPILRGPEPTVIKFPSSLCDEQSEEERPAKLLAVKHNPNLNSHKYLPKADVSLKIGTTFEFDLQFDRAFKMDSDSLKMVFKTDKLFIGEHMEVNVDLEGNKLTDSWCGQITSVKDDTLSLKVEIPEEISLGRWSLVVITKLLNSGKVAESVAILPGIYIC